MCQSHCVVLKGSEVNTLIADTCLEYSPKRMGHVLVISKSNTVKKLDQSTFFF